MVGRNLDLGAGQKWEQGMISFGRFAPALPAFCFFVLICKPLAARYGIGHLGFGQNDRRSAGLRFNRGEHVFLPNGLLSTLAARKDMKEKLSAQAAYLW